MTLTLHPHHPNPNPLSFHGTYPTLHTTLTLTLTLPSSITLTPHPHPLSFHGTYPSHTHHPNPHHTHTTPTRSPLIRGAEGEASSLALGRTAAPASPHQHGLRIHCGGIGQVRPVPRLECLLLLEEYPSESSKSLGMLQLVTSCVLT